jgi:hypothetical protein
MKCARYIMIIYRVLTRYKSKVHVYNADIPVSSADVMQFTPWYWNSLYYGLISLGRMRRKFLLFAVHTIHDFDFPFYEVPITAGWPEAM